MYISITVLLMTLIVLMGDYVIYYYPGLPDFKTDDVTLTIDSDLVASHNWIINIVNFLFTGAVSTDRSLLTGCPCHSFSSADNRL